MSKIKTIENSEVSFSIIRKNNYYKDFLFNSGYYFCGRIDC